MTDRYELSRRKTLAGLATIGAAGAGAGLGTSALFSDEESFEENTITAGTLDMTVTASVEAANDYWVESANLEELDVTADGEAVTGLQVEDVKPGDWGVICFDFGVAENPAYIQTTTANLETSENGYTEPEPTDGDAENDPNDEDGAGELQDFMIAEIYENHVDSDSDDPRDHVENLDPITPEGSTVQETYDAFSEGAIMGGSEDPMEVGSGEDGAGWCLLLWIPEEVENRIQGDSFSFDLIFNAEQVRNNDNPFNSTSAPQ